MHRKLRTLSCVFLCGMMAFRTSSVRGETIEQISEICLSNEEINLIALVTMAEAEGESEYGKRLVIDTVLNRMDSSCFPNTAYEVVYQPLQFTSVWNGRMDRCYVMEDIYNLVWEELETRTNYEVMFFTADGYGEYGVPLFREGNHYFCRYNGEEDLYE